MVTRQAGRIFQTIFALLRTQIGLNKPKRVQNRHGYVPKKNVFSGPSTGALHELRRAAAHYKIYPAFPRCCAESGFQSALLSHDEANWTHT